jgi:hypothetical protein
MKKTKKTKKTTDKIKDTVEEVKIIEKKMDFAAWYYSKKIPKMHTKEIIFADFKARDLTKEETKEKFDEALKKYGLDL